MCSANISLEEIIRRKMQFAKDELNAYSPENFSDDPHDISYEEFCEKNNGEITGYKEMLEDINILSEEEFKLRYCAVVTANDSRADKEEREAARRTVIDKMSGKAVQTLSKYELYGYCNAAMEILDLFDPVDWLTVLD